MAAKPAEKTAPSVSITAQRWTNCQTIPVSWKTATTSGSPAAILSSWKLDKGVWSDYDPKITSTSYLLTEGDHMFSLQAKQEGVVSAVATQQLGVDLTAPVVTATPISASQLNANGWYNKDVTVRFNGTDALSGIAKTDDAVTKSEGINSDIKGSATDNAGNIGYSDALTVKVDETAPTIDISGIATAYTVGDAQPTVTWTATDALSGIDTSSGTLPTGSQIDISTPGDKTFTVIATDNAGNTASKTVSYAVAPKPILDPTPIVIKEINGASVIIKGGWIPTYSNGRTPELNGYDATGEVYALYNIGDPVNTGDTMQIHFSLPNWNTGSKTVDVTIAGTPYKVLVTK
ncbi:hypothetical protein E4K68_06665 [Desulfosporosinus sp. Sb-LF]|nr:hypothetical protein E4K68_06665 [Desulfosporosinus sp. Sb-LF]